MGHTARVLDGSEMMTYWSLGSGLFEDEFGSEEEDDEPPAVLLPLLEWLFGLGAREEESSPSSRDLIHSFITRVVC